MRTPRLIALACASSLLCATMPATAASFLDRIKEKLQERRAAQDPGAAYRDEGDVSHITPSIANLAYGTDPLQRMDVYLPPKNARVQGAPVIFMVHGGAWRFGDKGARSLVDNKAARWTGQGMVFVSVNYRLLPQADPLEQARDVAHALAVAQAKASTWGADPARFVLMGHSAGAHLVSLVNASTELAAQAGARSWLGTVALDSAAIDVSPIMEGSHFRFYDAAFGTDPAFWKAVSPLQQLTAVARPMLLVCSSQRIDSCPQADKLAERAATLGVRAEVLRQDLSHLDINQKLGLSGDYTGAVEAFMGSLDAALAQRLAPP